MARYDSTEKDPAAFVDRDGVINEDRGYVGTPGEFSLLPGAVDGLAKLRSLGFKLVVVTNQSGIARGYYTDADFHKLTVFMRGLLSSHGVTLDGVYYCPHHPQHGLGDLRIDCGCRKPKPGLIHQAEKELNLDLARSVLVGDKKSDIEAGRSAGLQTCVLVRSGQALDEKTAELADHCADDLLEAADWLASL